MTPTARHLPEALAQSEAGSALLQRFRASQRAAAAIEAECHRILPGFYPTRSGSCELRGTTLRVNAPQQAQVAKLRQAIPRFLRLLKQHGFDVIEIKIGVQPRALSSSVQPSANAGGVGSRQGTGAGRPRQPQMAPALAFATKLALTLPESPLRSAARRLVTTLTSRVAETRDSDQPGNEQDGEEHDA